MNNLISTRRNDYQLKYDETELRLGLPGGEPEAGKSYGKRGFTETDVDLKLNLHMVPSKDVNGGQEQKSVMKEKTLLPCVNDPAKPSAHKAQLVGWPPVRSYRKNILAVQSSKNANEEINPSAAFVKVSMDGAPYLRKVDLKLYKSYQELSNSLEKMFSSFTIGMNEGKELMTDSKNKLMALVNESEYVPTYEDKDGDWMLVGDVPWEMFVDSCKRLRIMKRSEAIGLEPRVMEKCKNKS